ncbi:MAG: 50S ribosomal protein L11 methyltransferase [Desulfuromonadales bacterium]|nr:50S ribosomal protein L11 methyltransferase [Desulfuromonadales bacterium]MDT8424075.1 50S ribosomal protein L11 methyltransferase [Desulfuromonadales bacterium]
MSLNNFPPLLIGERFRIVSPDQHFPPSARIDLIMSRGAFGSGEHETTASCLNLLSTLPALRNARVLDLGSGTGVLALAALKLGAAHAVCVDIEADAVATARLNGHRNDLSDRLTHIHGTLNHVDSRDFDLILANIYGDILVAVAPSLVDRAQPGATLLLSGILWEDNFPVRQCYERLGCTVIANRMLSEFSSVILHAPL